MTENQAIIDALSKRVSHPRLQSPAPEGEQLKRILKTALRAPDHMMLRPARYFIVTEDKRAELGRVFEKAGRVEENCSDMQAEKYRNMPMRAPMLLIAVSRNFDHPKVPPFEQEQSVAAGLAYILVALEAEGYAGMWRTGNMALSPFVKKSIGLDPGESIVGFLYIGTPVGEAKPIPELAFDDFFQDLEVKSDG
jgi:nitroreductase